MTSHFRRFAANYSEYAPHINHNSLRLSTHFPYHWPHYKNYANTIPLDAISYRCEDHSNCSLIYQEEPVKCQACIVKQGGPLACIQQLC